MLFQQLHTNGSPVPMDSWEEFQTYVTDLEEAWYDRRPGEGQVGRAAVLVRHHREPAERRYSPWQSWRSPPSPMRCGVGCLLNSTRDAAHPQLAPWFLQENKW